jgi:hypothetical protein
MKGTVLIAHAKDEEGLSERIAEPLTRAGYKIAHRGTTLVGESYVENLLKTLSSRPVVILCGTIKAVGTHWGRKIVDAAREWNLKVIILKIDEEAAVETLSLGERVIEYWRDPDRAMVELLQALSEYYPTTDKAEEHPLALHTSKAEEYNRYEQRFAAAVVVKFDRMELFGVPGLAEETKTHALSVAYVSLTLDAAGVGKRSGAFLLETLIEHAEAGPRRLVIQGEAGGGKTTLMKWLAVEACRSRLATKADVASPFGQPASPTEQVRPWRDRLPLLLRLRDFPAGQVPSPDLLHQQIAPELGAPPEGWAVSLLESGRAMVLLDGIDEVPVADRENLRESIRVLASTYARNLFVLTTRPLAEQPVWLAELGFAKAQINPMSDTDRNRLIRRWHEAVADRYRQLHGQDDPDSTLAEDLVQTLDEAPGIKRLATNPLLCAVICALHRDLDKELPESQGELCDELIKLLIDRRDRLIRSQIAPAPYASLDYTQKRALVRHLAHYMVLNEISTLPVEIVDAKISGLLKDYPNLASQGPEDALMVRQALLERSGLLVEAQPGRVDFLHNTFKDYLAAEAFVSNLDVGYFLRRALEPAFQPVLLFAVRVDNALFSSDLINGLLAASPFDRFKRKADRSNDRVRAKLLLAIQCRFLALRVPRSIRDRVDQLIDTVAPPTRLADAASLATCGDAIVHLLGPEPSQSGEQSAACVRTLRLISSRSARKVLSEYLADQRTMVVQELAQAVNPLQIKYIFAKITSTGLSSSEETVRSQVVDLSPLRERTEVKSLNFDHTPVTDLGPLSGLPGLRRLTLCSTPVQDLRPLSGLTGLAELNLSSTPVRDLGPLSSLTGLRNLNLCLTPATDLRPLSGLTGLRNLNLCNTAVTDLRPLSGLTGLAELNLSSTPVTGLGPLSGLTGLRKLNLSSTSVADLGAFSGLTGLRKLNLSSTPVTDLGPLSGLTGLAELDLGNDKLLSNIDEL